MNKPRIARIVVGTLLAGAIALPAGQISQASAAPDEPVRLKALITRTVPNNMVAMSKKSEGPWP